jgi:Lrp/AsnC family transcriptional regulator, leucine-responsive regulatory protein
MLDAIDQKIVSILQANARSHLGQIAKRVDLSAPAIMERIKKLEAKGIIRGYEAILDAKKLGKDITAFVSVSIGHQRHIAAFSSFMLEQGDVQECHHVTGEESFILKVKCDDTIALERLLAEIRSMEGVTHTVTKVVLSTLQETQRIELENERHKSVAELDVHEITESTGKVGSARKEVVGS